MKISEGLKRVFAAAIVVVPMAGTAQADIDANNPVFHVPVSDWITDDPDRLESYTNAKAAIEEAGGTVIEIESGFQFGRDAFIVDKEKKLAFYPAGANLDYELHQAEIPLANSLIDAGYTIQPVAVDRNPPFGGFGYEHNQGGNFLIDYANDWVLMGSNAGELTPEEVKIWEDALGRDVHVVQTDEIHIDLNIGFLPTRNPYGKTEILVELNDKQKYDFISPEEWEAYSLKNRLDDSDIISTSWTGNHIISASLGDPQFDMYDSDGVRRTIHGLAGVGVLPDGVKKLQELYGSERILTMGSRTAEEYLTKHGLQIDGNRHFQTYQKSQEIQPEYHPERLDIVHIDSMEEIKRYGEEFREAMRDRYDEFVSPDGKSIIYTDKNTDTFIGSEFMGWANTSANFVTVIDDDQITIIGDEMPKSLEQYIESQGINVVTEGIDAFKVAGGVHCLFQDLRMAPNEIDVLYTPVHSAQQPTGLKPLTP